MIDNYFLDPLVYFLMPILSFICDIFNPYTYALFNSRRNLSAIIAINSEFVGFPLAAEIV